MGAKFGAAAVWILFARCLAFSQPFAPEEEPFVVTGPGIRDAREIVELLTKHPSIKLQNVTIKGELDLNNELNVNSLACENVDFTGDFKAVGSKGDLEFTKTTFQGVVDFYICQVGSLDFDDCDFRGNANFHSLSTPSFSLVRSTFRQDAVFVASAVENLNLADTHFERAVDFSGAVIGEFNGPRIRSKEPIVISWAQFGNKSIAGYLEWAGNFESEERLSRLKQMEADLLFWKRNFLALGAQSDARIVNYEIIRLRHTYFMSPRQFDWWATFLLSLPNGYGTSPYRPLWIALIIIALFAVVYWRADSFVAEGAVQRYPKIPLLPFAFFYSIDTFLPFVNVSGVKDWGWKISQKYRWVELVERLLGLLVSALAAYSLGSYLI
jgi:hypothetical protein